MQQPSFQLQTSQQLQSPSQQIPQSFTSTGMAQTPLEPQFTPIQTGFTPTSQMESVLVTETPRGHLSASYSELTGFPTPTGLATSSGTAVVTTETESTATVLPVTTTTETVPSSVASSQHVDPSPPSTEPRAEPQGQDTTATAQPVDPAQQTQTASPPVPQSEGQPVVSSALDSDSETDYSQFERRSRSPPPDSSAPDQP